MAAPARRKQDAGQDRSDQLLFAMIGCGVAVMVVAWASLSVGELLAGQSASPNPPGALLEVANGERTWPAQATIALIVFTALSLAGVIGAGVLMRRRRGRRQEIDKAASTMTPGRKLRGGVGRDADKVAARLLPTEVRREITAAVDRKRFHAEHGRDPVDGDELSSWVSTHPRIGTAAPGPSFQGVRLGVTVSGGVMVYQPWELPGAALAGTRMGKTAALAICAVCDAPGPVIANSNKPDLYGHTRLTREQVGDVWVVDLQGIAGPAGASFWVDLLKRVTRLAHARRLASFFVSASTAKGARVDAYFDGGAQELLALYMLAAALAGGDLLHVVEWLGKDQNPVPHIALRQHGKTRAAARVEEAQALHPRQRQGLYDMARRFLDVLSDDEYAEFVLPPSRVRIGVEGKRITVEHAPTVHSLPEFDPLAFVTSYDTLYPLSRKGPDSTAPLTTALIGQVLDAAVDVAVTYPHARLRVPLLAVLDEAANTCKLAELPDQYSYLGGHGVVLLSILQSRKQGARVWGEDEFAEMLDQAVHYYGGNITDTQYLQELSTLTGPHQVATESTSRGAGGTSRSRNWHDEPILSVDQLGALPKDRALVRLPENKPVLIRKLWWWETEHAEMIELSLARYGGATPADGDELGQVQTTATTLTPSATTSGAIEL